MPPVPPAENGVLVKWLMVGQVTAFVGILNTNVDNFFALENSALVALNEPFQVSNHSIEVQFK